MKLLRWFITWMREAGRSDRPWLLSTPDGRPRRLVWEVYPDGRRRLVWEVIG